jgi:uncharacterized protein YgbK (DUF1537 family)
VPAPDRRARALLTPAALRPLRGDVPHGLIVVGSHVALTTRQLDRLRERGGVAEYELDVALLLDEERRDAHTAEVAAAVPSILLGVAAQAAGALQCLAQAA